MSRGKAFSSSTSARVALSDDVPQEFLDTVNEIYSPPESFARKRGDWWGLLAACCLAPPTEHFFESVDSNQLRSELEQMLDEDVASPFVELVEPFDRELAKRDFNALFKAPGSRYLLPNESVWVDKTDVEGNRRNKPLLMGPATVDAARRYRLFSIEIDPVAGELPDYIGLELLFMEQLCAIEVGAWAAEDHRLARFVLDQQRSWLDDHLLRWVEELCAQMELSAESSLFVGLSRFIPAFCLVERAVLVDLVGE